MTEQENKRLISDIQGLKYERVDLINKVKHLETINAELFHELTPLKEQAEFKHKLALHNEKEFVKVVKKLEKIKESIDKTVEEDGFKREPEICCIEIEEILETHSPTTVAAPASDRPKESKE